MITRHIAWRDQARPDHRHGEEFRTRAAPRHRGATLVDVLVGLAVALFTMVVVYQAFAIAQSLRRHAAAAADAHASGMFALLSVATHAGNAGAGIASAARWLDTCPDTADIATTLRPLAVLVTDGGSADRPDTLVVRQSLATRIAAPATFVAAAPAGASFRVESVDGFSSGDRVVAISRTGTCVMTDVSAIASEGAGVVDIAHTPVSVDLPANALLLDLGPAIRAATARYDVVSGTLRSTDIGNGDAPNPLVSNIVNLKIQYGIDSDGDHALDTWVTASDAWGPAAMLAAARSTLDRIKALRIGVIARTERTDRTQTRAYRWVLFDCELADKSACPGRLEGTIAAAPSGGYRYRAFETIVPLRNAIWNAGS